MKNTYNHPELDFTRISALYANTYINYVGIATSVFVFAFIISQFSTVGAAYLWAIAVGIGYIPRLILSLQFSKKLKKREITASNIKPWENYFIYCSIVPFFLLLQRRLHPLWRV